MLKLGRRCVAIARFHHRFRGTEDRAVGPVQVTWDDGDVQLFDVQADWTLDISDRSWVDPLAGAHSDDLGTWVASEDSEPLTQVVGQALVAASPERNEMGELVGATLRFEGVSLRLFSWEGNLRVEVT